MRTMKCDACKQVVVLDFFDEIKDEEINQKFENHNKKCVGSHPDLQDI